MLQEIKSIFTALQYSTSNIVCFQISSPNMVCILAITLSNDSHLSICLKAMIKTCTNLILSLQKEVNNQSTAVVVCWELKIFLSILLIVNFVCLDTTDSYFKLARQGQGLCLETFSFLLLHLLSKPLPVLLSTAWVGLLPSSTPLSSHAASPHPLFVPQKVQVQFLHSEKSWVTTSS